MFSSGRNRKNRRFSYEPRHYNPEKDEKLKRRLRIRSRTRRGKSPGLLYLAVMLLMIFLVYNAF